MTTFESLGLPASILAAVKKVGFTTPTPIQALAIPFAMQGRDVLGSAQTGTGKTAAFGLPMLAKLIAEPRSMGIIMTPTRELAAQVLSTLQPLLAGHRDIRTALLIGGEAMPKQYQQLKQNPRIIVGTPGRINDHLERRSLNLSNANFLVLDETDRMLDMGFGVQIDRILKFMPKQRQTLLFSATIPPEIAKLANKYQTNPERVSVGSATTPIEKIKQELVQMSEGDKYQQLLNQLYDRKGSILGHRHIGALGTRGRAPSGQHHSKADPLARLQPAQRRGQHLTIIGCHIRGIAADGVNAHDHYFPVQRSPTNRRATANNTRRRYFTPTTVVFKTLALLRMD